jgi:chromosome segregation ATPase
VETLAIFFLTIFEGTRKRGRGDMGEKERTLLTAPEEREVKKANRELNNLTSKMDDLQKIETLQKRVTEHLADMKRLERENLKNKKRGDMLQKEKDHARTELSKSMTLKEKLEKLCRELQRENNRLKVLTVEEEAYHSNGSADVPGIE